MSIFKLREDFILLLESCIFFRSGGGQSQVEYLLQTEQEQWLVPLFEEFGQLFLEERGLGFKVLFFGVFLAWMDDVQQIILEEEGHQEDLDYCLALVLDVDHFEQSEGPWSRLEE